MKLSPSWETPCCSAAQELPNILLNPNLHYRVHKSHPIISILIPIYPVQTTKYYVCKIYFIIIIIIIIIIIHPPKFWSSQKYHSFLALPPITSVQSSLVSAECKKNLIVNWSDT
jgi:1,4-dihydroxy-2-naphthoate octaprenyltransferase